MQEAQTAERGRCIEWLREMGLLTRQKHCHLCQSPMTEGINARSTNGRARTLHWVAEGDGTLNQAETLPPLPKSYDRGDQCQEHRRQSEDAALSGWGRWDSWPGTATFAKVLWQRGSMQEAQTAERGRCIEWLREMGLLTRQTHCHLCQSPMTEGINAKSTDGRARTLHWVAEGDGTRGQALPTLPNPYDRGDQCQEHRRHSLAVQPQDLPHPSINKRCQFLHWQHLATGEDCQNLIFL